MSENKTMADPHCTLARPWRLTLALVAVLTLTACDQLGIETPGIVAAKKEAEGRAIGSACRHAVRSIEDCYLTNPRASKAAIFSGWREMDEYMRENDIAGMPASAVPVPVVSPPEEVVPSSGAPTTASPTPTQAGSGSGAAAAAPAGSAPRPNSAGAPTPPPSTASNAPAPGATTPPSTGTVQLPAIPGRPSIAPAPAPAR